MKRKIGLKKGETVETWKDNKEGMGSMSVIKVKADFSTSMSLL
jgi:hypothetical protein